MIYHVLNSFKDKSLNDAIEDVEEQFEVREVNC